MRQHDQVAQIRLRAQLPLAARGQAAAASAERGQHHGRTAHGVCARTDRLSSGEFDKPRRYPKMHTTNCSYPNQINITLYTRPVLTLLQ